MHETGRQPMSKPSRKSVIGALLEHYGRTYSEELKLGVERNTPSGLFQLLCFSMLASTRISHDLAARAMTALRWHGWRTPQKMVDATWRQRTDVLNHAGYARYDESTSRYLADSAQHLLDAYGGDLRRLRAASDRDVKEERRRLQEFKGIGETGADIFQREAQVAWPEMAPFLDKKAQQAAARLGLPKDPRKLIAAAPRKKDGPRLVAALVRCSLDKGFEDITSAAAQ